MKRILLSIVAVMSLPFLVLADAAEKAADANQDQIEAECRIPYSSEYAMVDLETEYDLWLEATLTGDNAEAALHEHNLLGIVSYNILIGQEDVRRLARQVALATPTDSDTDKAGLSKQQLAELQKEFQAAIANLNTKELLYRSLTRTDAFSNKFRLLGDYKNLLRKELDLPRYQLAQNSQKDKSSEGSLSESK